MTVLVLTAAYVLVVLFLLLAGLRANYRWQMKLAIILVCSLFYVVTWKALPEMLGWPADELLPGEFQLVAQYIEQPNKRTGDEGAIYMWVIDLAADADKTPRAYRLPYAKQLHEDVMTASAGSRPQKGKRMQRSGNNPGEASSGNIVFEDMPKVRLPVKK